MHRQGMMLGLALLVVVGGAVFGSTGWFGSSKSSDLNSPRDAAWHYRQCQPHHWRACMLKY